MMNDAKLGQYAARGVLGENPKKRNTGTMKTPRICEEHHFETDQVIEWMRHRRLHHNRRAH